VVIKIFVWENKLITGREKKEGHYNPIRTWAKL
jgi:hypothetical protein